MNNDAILFIFPVVNYKAIWALVFIHMNIAFKAQPLRHLITTMLLPCIHIQNNVSFGGAARWRHSQLSVLASDHDIHSFDGGFMKDTTIPADLLERILAAPSLSQLPRN